MSIGTNHMTVVKAFTTGYYSRELTDLANIMGHPAGSTTSSRCTDDNDFLSTDGRYNVGNQQCTDRDVIRVMRNTNWWWRPGFRLPNGQLNKTASKCENMASFDDTNIDDLRFQSDSSKAEFMEHCPVSCNNGEPVGDCPAIGKAYARLYKYIQSSCCLMSLRVVVGGAVG